MSTDSSNADAPGDAPDDPGSGQTENATPFPREVLEAMGADLDATKTLAESLKPAGGWLDEDTAQAKLRALPETLDGRRPEVVDDVVECVCRDVLDTDRQARMATKIIRDGYRDVYDVDLRRVGSDGPVFLGSIVSVIRGYIRNGREAGRLQAGAPGRN